MTTVEFTKIIDKTSFSSNLVELAEAENSIIKLKILNHEEAKLFFNNLKEYYPAKMSFDKFVNLLEIESDYQPVYSEIKDTVEKEETLEVEDVNLIHEKKITEENENKKEISKREEKRKMEDDEEDYRIMILKKRNISAIETMLIKKSSREIQRIYRGHLSRREFTITRARELMLLKRIQVILR